MCVCGGGGGGGGVRNIDDWDIIMIGTKSGENAFMYLQFDFCRGFLVVFVVVVVF